MFKIPAYLMQQDISIELYQGNTATGSKHQAPVMAKGRFEPSQQRTVDYKGTEVVSSGRLYLYPFVTITPQSKVTINGQTYFVIKVTPLVGFKKVWYLEVIVR